jgi:cytidylate kinase
MVIAIDGPAAAGKSTVARALARELGFTYLDSGAMYRCVGLLSLREPAADPAALARAATIELAPASHEPAHVLLDGRDVTQAIRAPEVSQAASLVAADARVRSALAEKQRELIATGDWVVEGRDIGTVIAPDAALKVFLTAELGADAAMVLAEQTLRDERDSTRTHSPLRPASGAVRIDTTGLRVPEVVERIATLARAAASS